MVLLFLHTNLEEIYYRVCIVDMFLRLPGLKYQRPRHCQTRSRPAPLGRHLLLFCTAACHSLRDHRHWHFAVDHHKVVRHGHQFLPRPRPSPCRCSLLHPTDVDPAVDYHEAEQSGSRALPNPPRLPFAVQSGPTRSTRISTLEIAVNTVDTGRLARSRRGHARHRR
jgi:hypothetical protein